MNGVSKQEKVSQDRGSKYSLDRQSLLPVRQGHFPTPTQFRRNLVKKLRLLPGLGAESIAVAMRSRLRPQHTVKPANTRRIIEVKVSQKPLTKRVST